MQKNINDGRRTLANRALLTSAINNTSIVGSNTAPNLASGNVAPFSAARIGRSDADPVIPNSDTPVIMADILYFYSRRIFTPKAILAFCKSLKHTCAHEELFLHNIFLAGYFASRPALSAASIAPLVSSFDQSKHLPIAFPPAWNVFFEAIANTVSAAFIEYSEKYKDNFQTKVNVLIGSARLMADALNTTEEYTKLINSKDGADIAVHIWNALSVRIFTKVFSVVPAFIKEVADSTYPQSDEFDLDLSSFKLADQLRIGRQAKNMLKVSIAHQALIVTAKAFCSFEDFQTLEPVVLLENSPPKVPSIQVPYTFILKNRAGVDLDRHVIYSGTPDRQRITFGITNPFGSAAGYDLGLECHSKQPIELKNVNILEYECGAFNCPTHTPYLSLRPTNLEVYKLLEEAEALMMQCFAHVPQLFLNNALPANALVFVDRQRIMIGLPQSQALPPQQKAGCRFKTLSQSETNGLLSDLAIANSDELNFYAIIPLHSFALSQAHQRVADAAVEAVKNLSGNHTGVIAKAFKNAGLQFKADVQSWVQVTQRLTLTFSEKKFQEIALLSDKIAYLKDFLTRVDPGVSEGLLLTILQNKKN